MITLEILKRLKKIINIHQLATLAGMNASTLRCRLIRGGPEITTRESVMMRDALLKCGLNFTGILSNK